MSMIEKLAKTHFKESDTHTYNDAFATQWDKRIDYYSKQCDVCKIIKQFLEVLKKTIDETKLSEKIIKENFDKNDRQRGFAAGFNNGLDHIEQKLFGSEKVRSRMKLSPKQDSSTLIRSNRRELPVETNSHEDYYSSEKPKEKTCKHESKTQHTFDYPMITVEYCDLCGRIFKIFSKEGIWGLI